MEKQSRPKTPASTEPSERVYLGIDDTLANARVQNHFMEAKVVADGDVGHLRSSADCGGIQSASVVKQTICWHTAISTAVQPTTVYQWPRHGH